MRTIYDVDAELAELDLAPEQLVCIDPENPKHLDTLSDLSVKRGIEKAQPGDCFNIFGETWLLNAPSGDPIGFLSIRPLEVGVLGIDSVYVIPEYRGQGYGRALVLVAEALAIMGELPLAALQPLTTDGLQLIARLGVPIQPLDPEEATFIQQTVEAHWLSYRAVAPCKHRHVRSNRPACDKCLYKFAYAGTRKTLNVMRDALRLRNSLGIVA